MDRDTALCRAHELADRYRQDVAVLRVEGGFDISVAGDADWLDEVVHVAHPAD